VKSIIFNILPSGLLPAYKAATSEGTLSKGFDLLKDVELSNEGFSFYTSVASVYSSKIEGEPIELDSYIKHKRFGVLFEPDYTRKIDDLYLAYQYAKTSKLCKDTIAEVHVILTKHILAQNWQGRYRGGNMYVTTTDGRIEYVAATPDEVSFAMDQLYADIDLLMQADLTLQETFFFAALLHLVFVKIHPWNDGNGRSARLLEKWFLAQKLGAKAWFIQSEKLYYLQHQTYYRNIRLLGLEYAELDYSQASPFLLMLPQSLNMPQDDE